MKASDGALHGSRIIDDFLTTFMGVRRSLLFDTDDNLSGFHCCSPQIRWRMVVLANRLGNVSIVLKMKFRIIKRLGVL